MIIKQISIREKHSFNPKIRDFDKITILYSPTNSTGKTTLTRAILYGLGFQIPDTELVKFKNYEFALILEIKGKEVNILRNNNLLTINEHEFDLPIEQTAALSFLFEITNTELINNLLGTIYFDQEKGWTLLNRGTIIGVNHFSVEGFFRGLKNDESDDTYQILEEISSIEKKIAQYRLMINIAEYQASMSSEIQEKIDYQTYDEELYHSLLTKKQALTELENELSDLNEIIKKNKSFCDYIEQKKIYVKCPNSDEPIRVTRESLLEYTSMDDLNEARKSMLIAERNRLKKAIAKLEVKQQEQTIANNIPTIDEELTHRLSSIEGLNSIQLQGLINDLKKKKEKLSTILKEKTKFNNEWITKANEYLKKYAELLNLPIDYKLDIFTHQLKSKSGAVLHKMVFIYKLVYIKLLSEKIGYPLPIFCDSPSGREVHPDTITAMMDLLSKEFSEHQIIIASIYKYANIYPNSKIIELDGTLFNKQSLLD